MAGAMRAETELLDRVIAKLSGVKRAGHGKYTARCPAHDDRAASLSITLGDDGRLLAKCFAGCTFEQIAAGLEIPVSELFADNGARSNGHGHTGEWKRPIPITLAELAAHKHLPIDFLRGLGCSEDRQGVLIPYLNPDGSVYRVRRRSALSAKEGTRWEGGKGQIAYEPDLGVLRRQEHEVTLVEGETDTWTLLYAGFPAIGVPGADASGVLQKEHFEGVERVYAVREPDAGGEKFIAGVKKQLAELGLELPLYQLRMPDAAKDPSALYQRSPEGFAAKLNEAMKAARERGEKLASSWRTLGEWGALNTQPPARQWLLTRPDVETNGMAAPVGVLQRGKVGLLIAPGGVGKTMVLCGLSLAVATGRKWLDFFSVPSPGRVVLALGEEDAEEVKRKFYGTAHAMRLTDEQIEIASNSIVVLPLAGQHVALVETDGRSTTTTAVFQELRRRLGEQERRLIIFDPLSRFADADTERDNAAATRFIQAVEMFTSTLGTPAVLIAHHTNKVSRALGGQASAANARGSTAITDGGRWVAELESRGDEGARLTVTKSNYSPLGAPLELVRDPRNGGYLRVETAEEAAHRIEAREAKSAELASEHQRVLSRRVEEWLRTHPNASKKLIAEALQVRAADARVAVDLLVREGRIVSCTRYGYSLPGGLL